MKNNNSTGIIAIVMAIVMSMLTFHITVYAGECDARKIMKKDKTIKDVICDSELGNIYLKYSPRKRLIWIERHKTKSKLVLDHFEHHANPELVESENQIKFVSNAVIRINERKFIGAFYVHRSRSGGGMGYCGSGAENYFAAIEITNKGMKKNKVILIESCLELYQLGYEDDRENTNFLGKIISNEVVIYWLNYGDAEDVTGRYNFITNKLTVTEEPKGKEKTGK